LLTGHGYGKLFGELMLQWLLKLQLELLLEGYTQRACGKVDAVIGAAVNVAAIIVAAIMVAALTVAVDRVASVSGVC